MGNRWVKVEVKSLSRVQLLAMSWTAAYEAPPVHGFSRRRVLEWGAIAFSAAYLRLLIFLLAILIPSCALSSSVFLMMYSADKLNKQGDNIQP